MVVLRFLWVQVVLVVGVWFLQWFVRQFITHVVRHYLSHLGRGSQINRQPGGSSDEEVIEICPETGHPKKTRKVDT